MLSPVKSPLSRNLTDHSALSFRKAEGKGTTLTVCRLPGVGAGAGVWHRPPACRRVCQRGGPPTGSERPRASPWPTARDRQSQDSVSAQSPVRSPSPPRAGLPAGSLLERRHWSRGMFTPVGPGACSWVPSRFYVCSPLLRKSPVDRLLGHFLVLPPSHPSFLPSLYLCLSVFLLS